jgi:hypothetical protein
MASVRRFRVAEVLVLLAATRTAVAAPGLVLQTNQPPGGVANLEACAWHPYVAPALRLTGASPDAADPAVDYASVVVVSGNAGNDSLRLDPDPAAPCSWGAPIAGSGVISGPQTCGPCPPLAVAFTGAPPSNSSVLTLTGVAPASLFQACLRRLTLASVAYGGQEGLGPRTLSFAAHRAGASEGDNAVDTATVTWVPAVDSPPPLGTPAPDSGAGGGGSGGALTCSDLLPQGPRLTGPPEVPGGPLYEAGCLVVAPGGAPGPCAAGGYFTLLQPALAVTVPPGATEPGFLQYATVTLDWKRAQGVQARGQVRTAAAAAQREEQQCVGAATTHRRRCTHH